VVTRGGAGLTAFTQGGGEVSVPGEPIEVADTIGAGDTVNAALLQGPSARDALSADVSVSFRPRDRATCSVLPHGPPRSHVRGPGRSRRMPRNWGYPVGAEGVRTYDCRVEAPARRVMAIHFGPLTSRCGFLVGRLHIPVTAPAVPR
jgi:hypothetical protein